MISNSNLPFRVTILPLLLLSTALTQTHVHNSHINYIDIIIQMFSIILIHGQSIFALYLFILNSFPLLSLVLITFIYNYYSLHIHIPMSDIIFIYPRIKGVQFFLSFLQLTDCLYLRLHSLPLTICNFNMFVCLRVFVYLHATLAINFPSALTFYIQIRS